MESLDRRAPIATFGDTTMSFVHALRRPRQSLNDAALIDEFGREIPITEAMILRACKVLEQEWHYPTPSRQRARKAG